MNGKHPRDIPEENVDRLIASSVGRPEPELQALVKKAVLDELRARPVPNRRKPSHRIGMVVAVIAAAAAVLAIVLWNSPSNGPQQAESHPKADRARNPIWHENMRAPSAHVAAQDSNEVPPQTEAESPKLDSNATEFRMQVTKTTRSDGQAVEMQVAGRMETCYGLVSLDNGKERRPAANIIDVQAGHWIETHSGSAASILLPDESRLELRPRSRVQLAGESAGSRLVVQEGRLELDVVKQPPGTSLTVETPGAKITVLGTRLDVHVVQKPDGRRQTRVSVLSGKVQLESGGRMTVLLPNMEGVAQDGEPPRTRSLTPEVNEMIRLTEMTRSLAEESGRSAAPPSIVEFNNDGTATIWLVHAIRNRTDTDLHSVGLPSDISANVVGVYTHDGAKLPWKSMEDTRQVDLSTDPLGPGEESMLIVELARVHGVFAAVGRGTREFESPAIGSGEISLLQFRLPRSAEIEELRPVPIAVRETLSRLLVTVAIEGRLPKLHTQ